MNLKSVLIFGITGCLMAGGPNADAPPETAQYAFLVGVWDCTITASRPDGVTKQNKAVWKGYWILDGWAIQDDWVSFDENNTPIFFGTNIRSFNPKTKKWQVRWLSQGSLKWKQYDTVKSGGTMVMTGGEGKDRQGEYIDRNTFFDIEADSWGWRKDRSYDGGKNWIEGVAYISAKRSEKK